MILLLDFTNETARIAAVGAKDATWTAAPPFAKGGVFRAFDKARRAKGFPKGKPACVAVALSAKGFARDVSWSTVRAGVAMANGLAFAWGVPSVAVGVTGAESQDELAVAARVAAKKAKKGVWVSATYSGEPTITKAKKIL
jgi:hypothetical protein